MGTKGPGQQLVRGVLWSLPIAGRLGPALQSPHGLCLSIFKLPDKPTSLFKTYPSLWQLTVSCGSKILALTL